ncbi:hypothetical protein GPZ74_31720, partial [Burkholderia pseudomallei]|nr:hypothetical protein [Burkholderia pseudomallei]
MGRPARPARGTPPPRARPPAPPPPPAPADSKEPGSPAGYYYDLNAIQGFSVTHMSGAGCAGNNGEF